MTSYKVYKDVYPGAAQQGHRRTCSGCAGLDLPPGVLLQCGPPEAFLKEIVSSLGPRMAGKLDSMGPLDYTRPQGCTHVQVIWFWVQLDWRRNWVVS